MEGLLLRQRDPEQLAFDGLVMEKQETLYTEWESSAERERQSLTKFAQAGIHPEEVAREVAEIRSALGTRDEVSGFVREALAGLRATITSTDDGFAASTGTLPLGLRESLPPAHRDPLPFHSDLPTPRGEAVLTRTDPHVEAVARYVLDAALDPQMAAELRPARRCGVVRTHAVDVRTTLLLVRYRFHLTLPSRTGDRTLVAEDARLVAYRGAPASPEWLDERATRSLTDATADANVAPDQAHDFIDRALAGLDAVALHLEESGDMFADDLRESHRRVRAVTGEVRRGLTVTAQKPADVLGVYVYVPVTGGAR